MYEDLTSETFQADGEFWESIQTPWDDYDDYIQQKIAKEPTEEELNSISSSIHQYETY
jgi:hypothetical protein